MAFEDRLRMNVIWRIAIRLQNELIRACPVDTGVLRNSITANVEGNMIIISMIEYGKYVEFGTPPHVITAKDKKALKFRVGGKDVIVKSVNHPGTRPNPFIRTTIRTKLPQIVKEEIARVTGR